MAASRGGSSAIALWRMTVAPVCGFTQFECREGSEFAFLVVS